MGGSLYGKRVFCSDMTFSASVNPVVYEGGEPIFIDTEYDTWNMDPISLSRAFEIFPDVKLVVIAHLYGTPSKIDEIKKICSEHGALLIEDAAESLGASYKSRQTGSYGDYAAISFNGNKIITGSSGGMFLTNSEYDADRVRKWSTQSREDAPWYQHEELGYNYENSDPNYWLSCMCINDETMCETVRSDQKVIWKHAVNKSCPTEILEALNFFNAEGRPIWKPMHMQNIYKNNNFVGRSGIMRGTSNAYIKKTRIIDTSGDIFNRGLCLPSDIKMSESEQDRVIDIIHRCFE